MKKLTIILSLAILITSCKKTEDFIIPPGNPANEVKATVVMHDGQIHNESTNGNETVFERQIHSNGDTVITILGGGYGAIRINLSNIRTAGTYQFEDISDPRQYLNCTYSIGNILSGPFEMYSTSSASMPGTITIDSLTTQYIKGSFSTSCTGANGTIQINNGSFKGSFQ